MNAEQARAAVAAALNAVAPGMRLPEGDADLDLRRQLDLDSIDFVGFVAELERRTRLPLAEEDYAQLNQLSRAVKLLVTRSQATSTPLSPLARERQR
jgi:acyl carrier protein